MPGPRCWTSLLELVVLRHRRLGSTGATPSLPEGARLPAFHPKRSSALAHASHGLRPGRGVKERQDVDVLTSIELEEVGDERQKRLIPLAAKPPFEHADLS